MRFTLAKVLFVVLKSKSNRCFETSSGSESFVGTRKCCKFAIENAQRIMAAILNIETATDVCSVCLSVEGEMRWSDTDTKGRNHATVLGGMVAEALDYARQIETMPEAIADQLRPQCGQSIARKCDTHKDVGIKMCRK